MTEGTDPQAALLGRPNSRVILRQDSGAAIRLGDGRHNPLKAPVLISVCKANGTEVPPQLSRMLSARSELSPASAGLFLERSWAATRDCLKPKPKYNRTRRDWGTFRSGSAGLSFQKGNLRGPFPDMNCRTRLPARALP
jgi:hypothetical protein